MHAELKGLDSLEAPGGLSDFAPEDPSCFSVLVTASLGPPGTDASDLFSLAVCSASWLEAHPPERGFEFLRHTLVLREWDYALLERAVANLCRRTEGGDWDEVACRIGRYLAWEFEDYRR